MDTIKIDITRTCRVYSSPVDAGVSEIWLALHGYGSLASEFYQTIYPAFTPHHKLLVPEGFNRFYVKGLGGKVGANWMTSEDRLADIENIHHYLSQVVDLEAVNVNAAGLNLLGFSQGATTAMRWWLSGRSPQVKKLICWAGSLPSEYQLDQLASYSVETELYIVYGKSDPLLNDHYLEMAQELVHKRKKSRLVVFDGQHEVQTEVLRELIRT